MKMFSVGDIVSWNYCRPYKNSLYYLIRHWKYFGDVEMFQVDFLTYQQLNFWPRVGEYLTNRYCKGSRTVSSGSSG